MHDFQELFGLIQLRRYSVSGSGTRAAALPASAVRVSRCRCTSAPSYLALWSPQMQPTSILEGTFTLSGGGADTQANE